MTKDDAPVLIKLRDTGQTVADPAEDLRGRHVKDKDDQDIGTVHDLLVDSTEHKVRMLRLEHGGILGFGATSSFVPVQAITRITANIVYINQTGDTVAGAPRYDPDLADQTDYYANTYGYYGYMNFWGPGPM
jgi:sporulation protein YlmC with PRC-barrel domain